MMEMPSLSTDEAIKANVDRDLRPSPLVIHSKIAIAFALGALASMSVCAQFGLGITPWSHAIQMKLMALGVVACMTICGFLFAIFPLFLLRLMARPLQFRLIIRRHGILLLGWLIASELALLLMSGFDTALLETLIWSLSAAATIWLGTALLDKINQLKFDRRSLVF